MSRKESHPAAFRFPVDPKDQQAQHLLHGPVQSGFSILKIQGIHTRGGDLNQDVTISQLRGGYLA
ncbi:hypothetical protein ACFVKB_37200 [Rhodococcus sp. NPDC127530]|uniref:hypothetical protein n=1 Tax=unclassified Rhodococcus (in: high G+C Gram-positive bacteria) TaxID=192944 RepID=UPI0036402308